MEQLSPSQQVKRLEKYIYNLKAARELNMLSVAPREAMIALRTNVTAARTRTEDYFNADDTREQVTALEQSLEYLEAVRQGILQASTYDLLDAVDVAHLAALTEQIIERLR
jgi:hypothetical protein